MSGTGKEPWKHYRSVLPIPGDADDSVSGDRVVAGDDEVVAVGEVADGGRALQQPRAALRHLPARQAVVPLNLEGFQGGLAIVEF